MKNGNLASWSIEHKQIIYFFMFLCLVAGIYSYNILGRSEDPVYTVKQMVISAAWPGATAKEMEMQVTDKIEKEYTEGKNIGKKPRILVTGSPSGGAALKVIRAIEDNGGVVVCFENCTGMKPLAMVDEENPDVYDALARKYLNIGCSCMSPNKNRLDLLDELIDDFQVDGVVDLVLQACHTYNVETALIKKLVKDKKGIPYTVVETDYSQADIEQINTRMAAFIEML